MIELVVTSISTVSKPRTAVAATTDFAGFVDGTAFMAYGTDDRCRGCWCLHEGND